MSRGLLIRDLPLRRTVTVTTAADVTGLASLSGPDSLPSQGDVLRVPATIGRLAAGYYLVLRAYGEELLLGWVSPAADVDEVRKLGRAPRYTVTVAEVTIEDSDKPLPRDPAETAEAGTYLDLDDGTRIAVTPGPTLGLHDRIRVLQPCTDGPHGLRADRPAVARLADDASWSEDPAPVAVYVARNRPWYHGEGSDLVGAADEERRPRFRAHLTHSTSEQPQARP
jgi:hypothetical protein